MDIPEYKNSHFGRFCKQWAILLQFSYRLTPMTALGLSLYRNGKFLALMSLCEELSESIKHLLKISAVYLMRNLKSTRITQTRVKVKMIQPFGTHWPSQSAPTILVLKNRVDLSKIWGAKSRVQKTGLMLFKERRGQAALHPTLISL